MNHLVTSQSAVQERPIVRSFETRGEAEDYVLVLKKEVEEGCRIWKIQPVMSVEN